MSDEPELSYIYGLRADDCADYFYVGSTKNTPAFRLAAHWGKLKTNKNGHFVNKMKKIGQDHVVCDILEIVPRESQFKSEYEWINLFFAQGVKLTNIVREAHPSVVADYEARVSSPEFLREHLRDILEGSQVAENPADQPLFDSLMGLLRQIVSTRKEAIEAYAGISL